jgi:hypothetical protein
MPFNPETSMRIKSRKKSESRSHELNRKVHRYLHRRGASVRRGGGSATRRTGTGRAKRVGPCCSTGLAKARLINVFKPCSNGICSATAVSSPVTVGNALPERLQKLLQACRAGGCCGCCCCCLEGWAAGQRIGRYISGLPRPPPDPSPFPPPPSSHPPPTPLPPSLHRVDPRRLGLAAERCGPPPPGLRGGGVGLRGGGVGGGVGAAVVCGGVGGVDCGGGGGGGGGEPGRGVVRASAVAGRRRPLCRCGVVAGQGLVSPPSLPRKSGAGTSCG